MSRVLTYLRNKEWTDFSESNSNYRKEIKLRLDQNDDDLFVVLTANCNVIAFLYIHPITTKIIQYFVGTLRAFSETWLNFVTFNYRHLYLP